MTEPRKRNILFIAHDIGFIGGAERQLLELFRGLNRQRFDPLLVCLEAGGPVAKQAAASGVRVIHLPRRWRWDLGVAWRVRETARQDRAAIVHAYLGLPGFYGAVGGKLAGAKVIATIRIAGPRNRPGDFSERLAFLLADRIISNSQAGVDYYFRWFPGRGKARVIYNGYDQADFNPAPARTRSELGLPDEGRLVGHVANLTFLKDYPTLIKALRLVFAAEPDVRAVIVGDGPKRKEYQSLAEALGIRERTHFLGHRPDVLELVKHFDVCVLASHGEYSEGLSNSIAEYMGMARPVVATATGGNTELVRDGATGVLCPPGDPDAMARSILRLLASEDLRRTLGEGGRRFFQENLTLARMVEQTERVYEELLGEGDA